MSYYSEYLDERIKSIEWEGKNLKLTFVHASYLQAGLLDAIKERFSVTDSHIIYVRYSLFMHDVKSVTILNLRQPNE